MNSLAGVSRRQEGALRRPFLCPLHCGRVICPGRRTMSAIWLRLAMVRRHLGQQPLTQSRSRAPCIQPNEHVAAQSQLIGRFTLISADAGQQHLLLSLSSRSSASFNIDGVAAKQIFQLGHRHELAAIKDLAKSPSPLRHCRVAAQSRGRNPPIGHECLLHVRARVVRPWK